MPDYTRVRYGGGNSQLFPNESINQAMEAILAGGNMAAPTPTPMPTSTPLPMPSATPTPTSTGAPFGGGNVGGAGPTQPLGTGFGGVPRPMIPGGGASVSTTGQGTSGQNTFWNSSRGQWERYNPTTGLLETAPGPPGGAGPGGTQGGWGQGGRPSVGSDAYYQHMGDLVKAAGLYNPVHSAEATNISDPDVRGIIHDDERGHRMPHPTTRDAFLRAGNYWAARPEQVAAAQRYNATLQGGGGGGWHALARQVYNKPRAGDAAIIAQINAARRAMGIPPNLSGAMQSTMGGGG